MMDFASWDGWKFPTKWKVIKSHGSKPQTRNGIFHGNLLVSNSTIINPFTPFFQHPYKVGPPFTIAKLVNITAISPWFMVQN